MGQYDFLRTSVSNDPYSKSMIKRSKKILEKFKENRSVGNTQKSWWILSFNKWNRAEDLTCKKEPHQTKWFCWK